METDLTKSRGRRQSSGGGDGKAALRWSTGTRQRAGVHPALFPYRVHGAHSRGRTGGLLGANHRAIYDEGRRAFFAQLWRVFLHQRLCIPVLSSKTNDQEAS